MNKDTTVQFSIGAITLEVKVPSTYKEYRLKEAFYYLREHIKKLQKSFPLSAEQALLYVAIMIAAEKLDKDSVESKISEHIDRLVSEMQSFSEKLESVVSSLKSKTK